MKEIFQSKEYAAAVRGRMIGRFPCDMSKAGPFTIAKTHFLNEDDVEEFVSACADNKVTPIFSSYADLKMKRFTAATVVVKLDEDINKQINKKQRWAANKATKSGVIIKKAKKKEEWEAYLKILKNLYKRKEQTSYQVDEEAYWAQHDSGLARLYIATWEGEIVAGGVFLVSAPSIYYYSGSVAHNAYHLQPMSLILRHVAEEYAAEGFTRFDLGGYALGVKVGSEQGRINKFKAQFGGVVEFWDYYPNSVLYYLKKIKDLIP